MTDLGSWPEWGSRVAWTVGTLAASWGIGYLLGAVIAARMPGWLHARQQSLAASAVPALRKRLPWWCLLVGAWVAAGYWPLTPEGFLLVGRLVFVVGALSVTIRELVMRLRMATGEVTAWRRWPEAAADALEVHGRSQSWTSMRPHALGSSRW